MFEVSCVVLIFVKTKTMRNYIIFNVIIGSLMALIFGMQTMYYIMGGDAIRGILFTLAIFMLFIFGRIFNKLLWKN